MKLANFFSNEVKIYIVIAIISTWQWLSLPADPLTFAAIVTGQTVIIWLAVDYLAARLPKALSIDWTFGNSRLVLDLVR